MTGKASPVKQAALVASIGVLVLVGPPVLFLTINTARRGALTLEQMAAAAGIFGMSTMP